MSELKPFLRFTKMDTIIKIERLRYAKICGERRLFHDLNKSETFRVTSRPSPPVFFSEAVPLNYSWKWLFENFPKFRGKHPRWISTLFAGPRPLYLQKLNYTACCLGIWRSYFSEYLWLIAAPKSSHQRCSIKKLFLKISRYSQENTRGLQLYWKETELYFWHHHSSSRIPRAVYPPNTKRFSFSECINSFRLQLPYYYANEDKK